MNQAEHIKALGIVMQWSESKRSLRSHHDSEAVIAHYEKENIFIKITRA